MATIGNSAGMDGMMVVSRAMYIVVAELRCTLAATIMGSEHWTVPPTELVINDWSSQSDTELTLSRSTRVGLNQHNQRPSQSQWVCRV